MDVLDIEVPRKEIKISKAQTVKDEIVFYGEDNKYPATFENLINASETARACVNTYANFIFTEFEDESIGDTVVGRTITNKEYTLNKFARDVAAQCAKFNGCYVQVTRNLAGEVVEVSVPNFTKVRFSAFDDSGRSNYAFVGDWTNEVKKSKFKKNFIKYPLFNNNFQVFKHYAEELGTTTSIYHCFLDEQYVYPCNAFETVAYDMGAEYEIQLNRYEEITQGTPAKLVIRTSFPKDEVEKNKLVDYISNFAGSKGKRVLLIKSSFDENGAPINNGYQLDTIPDTRDLSMFSAAEKDVANNIRKCIGIPSCLIDYNHGANIEVSGAQMKSAVMYFDELCKNQRNALEEMFNEIFKHTSIDFGSKNFKLKEKQIKEY